MAAVAGETLAGCEREDAGVRGASRDARDAAHGAEPPFAACNRRLPRRTVAGAPRYGSGALSRAGWPEPPDLDGVRGRGAQLRVLPASGVIRPAMEAVDRGATDRPARSHW